MNIIRGKQNMKHNIKRALALFLALLLATPTFAFAEEPAGGIIMLDETPPEDAGVTIPDPEPEGTGPEDAPLELSGLDLDLSPDGLIQGDVMGPAQDSVVTYSFIVDNTLFATQEAREGDLILRPEDPAAPQGQVFAGWVLEDGVPLFVDADNDGAIDPVVAHPDPLCPQVNVFARFVEAEVPVEESVGAEQPAEADQPHEGTSSVSADADQPTDPQEPSPLGEGGTAQSAVTEEVVPPAEGTTTGEEAEEETTSSVSADAEPASPKGEASGDADDQPTETEQPTDPQKPSPSGEGGSAEALTEEVVPPTEETTAPVEAEGEAIQPVSVVFDAMPETAVVTVYPAATEETPNPEAIPAQEDGSFALFPANMPTLPWRRAMFPLKTCPLP